MAEGFARMAEIVGVDHVGLGTDMRGLTDPSVLDDYRDLPLLTEKLLARGFAAGDVGKILGGNYARCLPRRPDKLIPPTETPSP